MVFRQIHTAPNQPCYNIAPRKTSNPTAELGHFSDEITPQNSSVPESIDIKALHWFRVSRVKSSSSVEQRVLPSVGFCATCDTLTCTWLALGIGRESCSWTNWGDCLSGTRTTRVFPVAIILNYKEQNTTRLNMK
jgi:hypothetical protein